MLADTSGMKGTRGTPQTKSPVNFNTCGKQGADRAVLYREGSLYGHGPERWDTSNSCSCSYTASAPWEAPLCSPVPTASAPLALEKASNTKFCHRFQQFSCTRSQNYDFCSTFVFTYTEVNPSSQNTQYFLDMLC